MMRPIGIEEGGIQRQILRASLLGRRPSHVPAYRWLEQGAARRLDRRKCKMLHRPVNSAADENGTVPPTPSPWPFAASRRLVGPTDGYTPLRKEASSRSGSRRLVHVQETGLLVFQLAEGRPTSHITKPLYGIPISLAAVGVPWPVHEQLLRRRREKETRDPRVRMPLQA